MGSSPSKQNSALLRRFDHEGQCTKHHNRTYTHFCEETTQLLCLNCYHDYKRSKVRRGNVTCVEIDTYFQSFNFKQKQTKTEDELRIKRKKLEEEVSQMEKHCHSLEMKAEGIVETVTSYTDRVIELLKHMSHDVCKQTQKLVQTEVDSVSKKLDGIKTDIKVVENQLDNLRQTKSIISSPAVQVAIAVKADTSANNIQTNKHTLVPTFIHLTLNKDLKLSDTVNATRTAPAVLGTVRLEKVENPRQTSMDILSDVSEESNSPEGGHVLPSTSTVVKTSSDDIAKGQVTVSTTQSERENVIKEEVAADEDDTKTMAIPQNITTSKIYRETPQQTQSETRVFHGIGNERTLLRHRHSTPSLTENGRSSSLGQSRVVRSSLSRISPLSPTTPSEITFGTPRPTLPMWTRQPRKVQEITLPPDKTTCNITGSVILKDGKIILADQKNSKLKLFDLNFDLLDEFWLPGQPHNVALDSNGKEHIAVSLPALHVVKLFELKDGKLTVAEGDIHTGPQCWGVEYISGKLTYTTDKDAVFRRQEHGFLKFPYSFSEPVSLYTDHLNKILYVSCNGLRSYSGSVVAMDFNGDIKFTYANKDLKHPVSIGLDNEGNVYVVDRDPHSVHLLTNDGHYGKVILDKKDGHFQHIRFFPDADTFLLSEKDSDKITIFQMQ